MKKQIGWSAFSFARIYEALYNMHTHKPVGLEAGDLMLSWVTISRHPAHESMFKKDDALPAETFLVLYGGSLSGKMFLVGRPLMGAGKLKIEYQQLTIFRWTWIRTVAVRGTGETREQTTIVEGTPQQFARRYAAQMHSQQLMLAQLLRPYP